MNMLLADIAGTHHMYWRFSKVPSAVAPMARPCLGAPAWRRRRPLGHVDAPRTGQNEPRTVKGFPGSFSAPRTCPTGPRTI